MYEAWSMLFIEYCGKLELEEHMHTPPVSYIYSNIMQLGHML